MSFKVTFILRLFRFLKNGEKINHHPEAVLLLNPVNSSFNSFSCTSKFKKKIQARSDGEYLEGQHSGG